MKDKRLLKSSSNRMISGVCGGIGEFFGIDPTVIRLICDPDLLRTGKRHSDLYYCCSCDSGILKNSFLFEKAAL